jgi:hypothetical protein
VPGSVKAGNSSLAACVNTLPRAPFLTARSAPGEIGRAEFRLVLRPVNSSVNGGGTRTSVATVALCHASLGVPHLPHRP